jgi:hypothetical protein
MKYLILTADSPTELEKKVEEALSHGWKLQGGVSMVIYTTAAGGKYTQAMVLDAPVRQPSTFFK